MIRSRRRRAGSWPRFATPLPKAEHDAEEWLAAMEALLLVAESDGPTMFARIGVMRALNRRKKRHRHHVGNASKHTRSSNDRAGRG
jgi:hypothetical protein